MNIEAIASMANAMRNQAISLVQQAEAILQLIDAAALEPDKPTCKACGLTNLKAHSMMGGVTLTICNDCGKDQAT